jgi:hypothetical protein
LLVLDRSAGPRVGKRAVALGDEPSYSGGACGREQVVGAFDPQPVGGGEAAFEVAGVDVPDGGQLVNDHLRGRLAHGRLDLGAIQRIGDDRYRAQL